MFGFPWVMQGFPCVIQGFPYFTVCRGCNMKGFPHVMLGFCLVICRFSLSIYIYTFFLCIYSTVQYSFLHVIKGLNWVTVGRGILVLCRGFLV